MSKAYYYCKNFSFIEVNNLFAYAIKDPSTLSQGQKITRLYKGTLRRLQAMHIHTIRRPNFDRFYDEAALIRKDFDAISGPEADQKLVGLTLEKYERFIEENFEPYAAMHECRAHSNLHGKLLTYGDEALATDHIGFYKPLPLHGVPTDVHFHEEYPHVVGAWIYNHHYMSDDFNYEDLETQYMANQPGTQTSVREQLDDVHN